MIIFKRLLIIYLLYVISVIFHELAHYIAAKMLKIEVKSLTIGEKFFAIRISKLSFSPLVISAYVEYNEKDLNRKSRSQNILFFLSGSIVNAVLAVVFLFFINTFSYAIYAVIINVFCIIMSLFPIKSLNNDFGEMYRHIRSFSTRNSNSG